MEGKLKERSLANQAIGLFIHTDRMHKKICEQQIGKLMLHRSQHMMLMHLARFGKAVSQKELAESLGITPAAATVSVKKLIAGGYIERRVSDKDARYNDVSITEKGEEIVKKSKEIFESIDKCMVSGISEEELRSFIEIIKKMKENLKGQLCEKGGI